MYKSQSQVFMMRQWRKNESKWLIQLSREKWRKKVLSSLGTRDLHCFFCWEQIFTTWQQKRNHCYSYRGFANLYRAHPLPGGSSCRVRKAIMYYCWAGNNLFLYGQAHSVFRLLHSSLVWDVQNLRRGGLTAAHIGGLMQQTVQN